MEDDVSSPGMCSPEVPAGVVASHSCALVYNGSESQGVAHAVTLLSKLLNCVDELQDKRGLLICKRASWESAVSILGRGLTDCFEDCTFPCSELSGPTLSGLDGKDSLELVLRHAFRADPVDMDMNSSNGVHGSLSDATEHDLCSQMSNTTIHSGCRILNDAIDYPVDDHYKKLSPPLPREHGDYFSLQKLICLERIKEERLKRLIIRFVDEIPLKCLEGGVELNPSTSFNSFAEPGMEMKWNYIQAANEIAYHPADIAVIVISGLSHMQLHVSPVAGHMSPLNSSRCRMPSVLASSEVFKSETSIHPFDSYVRHRWDEYEEADDTSFAYQLIYLRAYTFGLSLALNSLHANLCRCASTNGSLSKLYLLDRLPCRVPDQRKFIAFLRSRFQFVYRLE